MDHLITRETRDERCLGCSDWTRHVWWNLPLCVPCRKLFPKKENKMMTPNEYQQLALRTEKTPELLFKRYRYFDANWQPLGDAMGAQHKVDMDLLLHGLMGMVTETGEAMDMFKKHLLYGKKFDPVNVLEEAGDLLWYIAIALKACGFDMSEAMERNIEKLRKRYPDGFTEQKALVRDLDAERQALEEK